MTTIQKLTCGLASAVGCILCTTIVGYAVGHPISSFAWAGAPQRDELQPLIITAWLNHPPEQEAEIRRVPRGIEVRIDPEAAVGKATSVTVNNQVVGQAHWGRDQSGSNVTFWPVVVALRTT